MRVSGAVSSKVTSSGRRKARKRIRKEKKERLKVFFETKAKKGRKRKGRLPAVACDSEHGYRLFHGQVVTRNLDDDKDSMSRQRQRNLKHSVAFGTKEEVHVSLKDSVESSCRNFRYSRQTALIANSKEDKEIGRLEKKLGLKKGKKLPSTFSEDGLDFLLEVADVEIAANEVEEVAEKKASDTETDIELDGRSKMKRHVGHGEQVNLDNDSDIIDAEPSVAVKYLPPHLRKSEANRESLTLQRLQRVLRGLVNRLSEHNVKLIAGEVESLFRENSHNDMSSSLTECLLDSCVKLSHVGDQILMESILLLGLVCHNEGVEVGYFFLESLAKKLEHTYEEDKKKATKATANIVMLFAFLYTLQMIDCCLIYDLVRKFVASFHELDIELLLMLLSLIGPQLRKDDPRALKDIVVEVEAKASSIPHNQGEKSRVKFMVNAITALKNNNLRKLRHDPVAIDCYRQRYQELTKGRKSAELPMRMTLNDLLNADTHGRWWIVGSSWKGGEVGILTKLKEHEMAGVSDLHMLTLAHQQRMTSDIRRTIFCVLMSSDDYLDAFEKLLKLNLKEKQSREIVYVLLDCCLQEQLFNPFYAYLSERLCQCSRSYQVTLQYSIWDRLKAMESLTESNRHNLAKLLIHLFITKAMSLSVLKVIEFSQLGKSSVQFYSFLLQSLFDESEMFQSVFAQIAATPDLYHLREGLHVFMHHYMLDKMSNSVEMKALKRKIRLAERSMQIGMLISRHR
ncbi:nucleolar MIF4G domain-containing protein 1-like [Corticium candelabrum]|uniref:nucleolar MIF4G domain-containing protein 1-like n=1 Tax=Corticium candelabrum TaxID=121492 RepID=UPI002E264639|nr:nucleolar MIF4G domain-containing protein 1-like [Corticium candelabrum]